MASIPATRRLRRNVDGSVDVYFGPAAPAGREANWVSTVLGMGWLAMFQFYGPDKSLFEKTWKLPEIERVN